MIPKKNILMLCSWLDPKTGIGSFFWEQAEFMSADFNMRLCVFNSTTYGLSNYRKFFNHEMISINEAPNGLPIIMFNYPQFAHVTERLNLYLFRNYLRKFHDYLSQENFKIDLVHAQSIFRAGIMAQYYYEETGTPYILTEHNQFNYSYINTEEKKVINKIFLNDFDKLVVSHDKIRLLASNALYAEYIVIGNAVNDEFFNYYKKESKENTFNIITVGAYSKIKDQETMFKVLQNLEAKLPPSCTRQVTFTWLGYNGWGNISKPEVDKLITRFPLKNIKVKAIGKVDRKEIRKFLNASDLFLFTSIAEGMPVSVMEALTCGVPVCSTRCGGVDELIDDTNGKIFQIKDSLGISGFIADLYMGKHKFDNKKISEKFIEKWGKNQFRDRMIHIYNKMIEKYGNN